MIQDIVCMYACPTVDWIPPENFNPIVPLDPIIQIQDGDVICNWAKCEEWMNNPCTYCGLNKLFSRYYEKKIEGKTLR